MPEYLVPGLYLEEIPTGSKSIEGVSTSTAGFVGITERGPLKPTFISSFPEFKRIFGNYDNNSYLAYAVDGFFRNGGKRCFISRVFSQAKKGNIGTASVKNSSDQTLFDVKAVGPGKWGQKVIFGIKHKSNGDPIFQLTILYFSNERSMLGALAALTSGTELNKLKPDVMPDEVEIFDDVSTDPSKSNSFVKKVSGNSSLVELINNTATKDSYHVKPKLSWTALTGDPVSLFLKSESGKNVAKILAKTGTTKPNEIFVKISKATSTKEDEFNLEIKSFENPQVKLVDDDTNADQKTKSPVTIENISMDPGADNYLTTKLAATDAKKFITIEDIADKERPKNTPLTTWTPLVIGDDDVAATTSDFHGYEVNPTDPATGQSNGSYMTGLEGFRNNEEISIIASPDYPSNKEDEISQKLIEIAEQTNKFAIIQSKYSDGSQTKIKELAPNNSTSSKYAAMYAPWIGINNPLTDTNKFVPPCGHVAGVYARSDNLRGVHKAPANEAIRGVGTLQVEINDGIQSMLNPKGVNAIRSFGPEGILVWGARTTSTDPNWKYLNVRRLFSFIEKSLKRSTRWVVFEPNNEKLWSRLTSTVSQFLTEVQKSGAIMGRSPEEGFFVVCNRTVMSQSDIDNGRLVCLIGIAPTKPAEFVIFRLTQTKVGATLEEI